MLTKHGFPHLHLLSLLAFCVAPQAPKLRQLLDLGDAANPDLLSSNVKTSGPPMACPILLQKASSLQKTVQEKLDALPTNATVVVPVKSGAPAWLARLVPKQLKNPLATMDLESMRYIAKVLLLGAIYGFIFGMMGAGGSLILKPLMYFGFAITPFRHAVFNSFLVLVVLAGYGAALGQSKGKVVWRDVGILAICVSGLGCVVGALLASRVSDHAQLYFFALLILCVATYMLAKQDKKGSKDQCAPAAAKAEEGRSFSVAIVGAGIAVGTLSGFAGVGGGFMLVPLLTHMGHDMTTAVPTSQAVICLSSLAGFCWYAYFNALGLEQLRPGLCLSLMAVAMAGLNFSEFISSSLSQSMRQRIFALLLIGISFIIANPIFLGSSVGTITSA